MSCSTDQLQAINSGSDDVVFDYSDHLYNSDTETYNEGIYNQTLSATMTNTDQEMSICGVLDVLVDAEDYAMRDASGNILGVS